jgi:hypothetical protein
MVNDKIDRLRTSWMVTRRHYLSFLAVLDGVRQEIGEKALPDYCRDKLSISHDIIYKIADVLEEDDKKRVKIDLARDKAASKEQKKKERLERKRTRCLETIEKAEKKKQDAQMLLDSLQEDPEPNLKVVE